MQADPAPVLSSSTVPANAAATGVHPWSTILTNTNSAFIAAGATFLGIMVVSYLIRKVLAVRLKKVADRTETKIDNLALALITDIRVWSVFAVAIAIAASVLVLPEGLAKAIRIFAIAAVALQVILSSRILVEFALAQVVDRNKRADGTPDPSVRSAVGIARTVMIVLVGAAAILFALQNMGVHVTPLLGALGIGGIAIALAAQNILGDLFASFIIVIDKPFQIGDAIQVGDKSGTVERIGVKTTRLKAAGGEQIICCNSDLLTSRVHNFGRMEERRVVGSIGVTYETDRAKLKKIPEIVKAIVNAAENVRFDRCHFKNLGAYALEFEYVYFVTTPDFVLHTKAQDSINFGLVEAFAREGIEFAYPTSVQYAKVEKLGVGGGGGR
jgi:small-conductance mechanosensitive channel